MHLGTKAQPKSDIIILQNAVLCVDCESVTNGTSAECSVCGSRALLNLGRMLGGSLTRHRAERAVREEPVLRFDFDMTIALKQMEAKDLTAVLQGITSLIGPRLGRGESSFHVNVEPVVASSAGTELNAAA